MSRTLNLDLIIASSLSLNDTMKTHLFILILVSYFYFFFLNNKEKGSKWRVLIHFWGMLYKERSLTSQTLNQHHHHISSNKDIIIWYKSKGLNFILIGRLRPFHLNHVSFFFLIFFFRLKTANIFKKRKKDPIIDHHHSSPASWSKT